MNRGHVHRRCPKPLAGRCLSARCGHSYEWRFSHLGKLFTGTESTERTARAAMTKAMAKAAAGELQTKREKRQTAEAARIAAEEAAKEAERRIRTGAYFTTWLERRGKLRPSTRRGYEVVIESHIKPVIGDVPLADLTSEHIRAVLERMAEPDEKGNSRTVGTLSRVRSVLTSGLKAAVKQGLMPINVATGIEIPERASVGKATGRKPTFTTDELRDFLDRADQTAQFGPVLRFISRTGVRRGEAVGLRWDHVDLEKGVAHIRASLTVTQGRESENGPKTESGERYVGLDSVALQLLKDLKKHQAETALKLGAGDRYNPGGFVFVRPDGTHLRPDSISRAVRRITRAMGRSELHTHSLRHTRGTTFLEAGVDIKIVSDQLGHSDVAFTQRTYQHVSPTLATAAAKLAAAVLDAPSEARSVATPVASGDTQQ
jgi:integrase